MPVSKAGKNIAAVVPYEIAQVIADYSVKTKRSMSFVICEIITGELSLAAIKEELSK